ncbi:hypothetical protein BCR43DRAFT_549123 [Syncephalastrum racemosum]|uniref:NADH-ubiquinone reductase complex 1 MLRQ subunit-domain-containing protein n=1 Tax=Syncephalastrum racemosum TaxID=13706 RepID=A0A1X2H9V7_SYNRA|nr:hypothetical protein BCR43DRAFT_549123 [Syncephalastrum racemosum]
MGLLQTFARTLKKNPALTPLFAFSAIGYTAALTHGLHVLRTHPEVEVDRKHNPEPWNRIKQDQNVKMLCPHPDFYASRKDMKSPSFGASQA